MFPPSANTLIGGRGCGGSSTSPEPTFLSRMRGPRSWLTVAGRLTGGEPRLAVVDTDAVVATLVPSLTRLAIDVDDDTGVRPGLGRGLGLLSTLSRSGERAVGVDDAASLAPLKRGSGGPARRCLRIRSSSMPRGSVRSQLLGKSQALFRGVLPVGRSSRILSRKLAVEDEMRSSLDSAVLSASAEVAEDSACDSSSVDVRWSISSAPAVT